MTEPQALLVSVKPELVTVDSSMEESSKQPHPPPPPPPPKVVVLADLNANPPETDGNDSVHMSPLDVTRFLLHFCFFFFLNFWLINVLLDC